MLLELVVLTGAVAAAQGTTEQPLPRIAESRPVVCATPDIHPVVAASVTPADQIVDVRVFFRTLDPAPRGQSRGPARQPDVPQGPSVIPGDPTARLDGRPDNREVFPGDSAPDARLTSSSPDGTGWYRVRLSQEGEVWKGALPRPTSRLKSFAYYIEVFDASARVVRGEERSVRVASKGSPCAASETGGAPEGEVLVQAPSIDTAAVPDGFSNKGTKSTGASKVGVTSMGARNSLIVSLAVGAAAGAAALTRYQPEQPQSNVEILATEPELGATISLASPRISIRLRLTGPEDVAPGSVLVALRTGFFRPCIDLRVPHSGIRARTPVEVTVDQIFGVYCPAPFQIDDVKVEVRGPQERVEFGRQLPLRFSFVP